MCRESWPIKDSLTYRPSSQGWASRVLVCDVCVVCVLCGIFGGFFGLFLLFLLYLLASML